MYSVTRVPTHLQTLGEGVEHDDVAPLDPAPGHGVVAAVRVEAGLHPGPGVLDLSPGNTRRSLTAIPS